MLFRVSSPTVLQLEHITLQRGVGESFVGPSLTVHGGQKIGLFRYRAETTHVIFEPLDLIARLAALVPPSRLNLARFHGLFAPNSL